MLVWALVIWILTFLAAGYSLWNWRLLWTAEAKPACEYAQIYEKYCLAGLRYLRFGYYLLAANLAIALPWISWKFFRSDRTFGIVAYMISIAQIAGLTAGLVLYVSISQVRAAGCVATWKTRTGNLEEEV
jgi:hypothetical protein